MPGADPECVLSLHQGAGTMQHPLQALGFFFLDQGLGWTVDIIQSDLA